ncbi:MAG: response regulator [Spirochaetaceae bacterium]|nr:response regulator [Spirochaetaceae bacterium]
MKKILVVDDNLLTLKQLEVHLSQRYDVILAKTGKIAVEVCKTVRPDLVLLDVKMPEMDGYETMRELHKNPRLEFVPILFLTGSSDIVTELKCLEMGAMDFIAKPANKNILLHRIELHLQFVSYQTKSEEIVRDLENSIAASFAELIEYKTDYSGRHGEDTNIYTLILGEELLRRGTFGAELTELELEKIARASSFHDIGKIGISDLILRKNGPLTAEEFEIVKKHSVIGAEALANIYKRLPAHFYFKYAVLIARGHHEKWDGTGYPDGLKGEDIPLSCRIVGLTNVYAACRKARSYRAAMSHFETCALIREGSGTFFDPRIVEAFEGVKDKFDEMSEKSTEDSANE